MRLFLTTARASFGRWRLREVLNREKGWWFEDWDDITDDIVNQRNEAI